MNKSDKLYLQLIEEEQIANKVLQHKIISLELQRDKIESKIKRLSRENIMMKSIFEALQASGLGNRIKDICEKSLGNTFYEFND